MTKRCRTLAASAICVSWGWLGLMILQAPQGIAAQRSNPEQRFKAEQQVNPESQAQPLSPATQRLMTMFSPQIRTVLTACMQQGQADLAAAATAEGQLMCGDGSPSDNVMLTEYVDTVANVLAASSLIGFRTVLESDPRISPQMLIAFLADPQAQPILRGMVTTAVSDSGLLANTEPEAMDLLMDQVMVHLEPTLKDPLQLANLLGTPEQYEQVVDNFCTEPGMTVEEVQTLTPELSSAQLYAICIRESGLEQEILQSADADSPDATSAEGAATHATPRTEHTKPTEGVKVSQ